MVFWIGNKSQWFSRYYLSLNSLRSITLESSDVKMKNFSNSWYDIKIFRVSNLNFVKPANTNTRNQYSNESNKLFLGEYSETKVQFELWRI